MTIVSNVSTPSENMELLLHSSNSGGSGSDSAAAAPVPAGVTVAEGKGRRNVLGASPWHLSIGKRPPTLAKGTGVAMDRNDFT